VKIVLNLFNSIKQPCHPLGADLTPPAYNGDRRHNGDIPTTVFRQQLFLRAPAAVSRRNATVPEVTRRDAENKQAGGS
jgi:hypothetical protein